MQRLFHICWNGFEFDFIVQSSNQAKDQWCQISFGQEKGMSWQFPTSLKFSINRDEDLKNIYITDTYANKAILLYPKSQTLLINNLDNSYKS